MMPTFSSDFSMSLADSVDFARLSGDYNPLHVDPVAARRTRFGGTVTHGIHLFLRALDEIAAQGLFNGQEPSALSAIFDSAVLSGSTVSLRVSALGSKMRLAAETAGRPAFTGLIEMGAGLTAAPGIEDAEFAAEVPLVADFPPALTNGTIPLKLSKSLLVALFPSLAKLGGSCWIADLLATTQLVGMHCPGMHSIFSSFRLRRKAPLNDWRPSMHFRVQAMEDRFRLLRIEVAGGCLVGAIETFFRPRPVIQRHMKEVATVVAPNIFVGHRTLIVGGSRGLGELTAKIVASGGADVTLTYARGKEDAERVCAEVRELGRSCTARHVDVMAMRTKPTLEWLENSYYSHVYFFASPLIARNSGQWDDALFRQLTQMYVTAFALLVEHLAGTRSKQDSPLRFLYPSSLFVTQPETGFAEYATAKAAGEALCDQLRSRFSVRFTKPRLPRMRTDQTSTLDDTDVIDALPVMTDVIRKFHSREL